MAPAHSKFFSPDVTHGASKGKRLVKSALSSAIPVPVLPTTMNVQDRMNFLAVMASVGTSEEESVASWKVYILAYTLMLFPAIESMLPRDIYAPIPISTEGIETVIRAYDALEQIPDDYEADELHEHETAFIQTVVAPGVPRPGGTCLPRYLREETTRKIIACHYSILLFMAGKRVDGADHSSLTRARPEALIKKAHLPADPQLLTGANRFSNSSHKVINSAWQELAALRSICFRTFAEYSSEDTDEVQDLVYTTMHLLRYSGMQHAKIVHGFLQAYPWARDVPALRTSIAKFDESIIQAARYPRNIQPYVKLIYADKAEIFPRKEMEVLIACAVASTQDTAPDIVSFYTSDAFISIVEAFLAERDRRGNVRNLTLMVAETTLAQKAGVSLGGLNDQEMSDESGSESDNDEEELAE